MIDSNIQTVQPLVPNDLFSIDQLNARYFHSLDGLLDGDNAKIWVSTFTEDGIFSILDANGKALIQGRGTEELIEVYHTFTDILTTRHWSDQFLIEPDERGAKSSCYIVAMSISSFPSSIVRSGIYKDYLVRVNQSWRFQNRQLILDPNSPLG